MTVIGDLQNVPAYLVPSGIGKVCQEALFEQGLVSRVST